jgi:hypothetical protein
MEPTDLTVFQSPFVKRRIGKNNDGGYIICEIPNIHYSILLAGGVADDISFEEHLCSLYPDMKCIGFDGSEYCTITNSRLLGDRFVLIKKNIGVEETTDTTNLFEWIAQNDDIFIKMDIEGAELPWLRCLTQDQQNKFAQIVMEFHFPFSEEDRDVLANLNKTHLLVHVHGNNCPAGVVRHKNVVIPNVFECTYIHRKYVSLEQATILNHNALPGPLDMPNCGGPDIDLNYPPFVNKKS